MVFDWGKRAHNMKNCLFKLLLLYFFVLALYLHHIPEEFFQAHVEVKTAKTHGRYWIFAYKIQLKLIKKAKRWYINGTFW